MNDELFNLCAEELSRPRYFMGLIARIYPSNKQKRIIAKCAGAERYVFNRCIEIGEEIHELRRVLGRLDLKKDPRGLKRGLKELYQDRLKFLAKLLADPEKFINMAPFLNDSEIDPQTIYNAMKNYEVAVKKHEKGFQNPPKKKRKDFQLKYHTYLGVYERLTFTDEHHMVLPVLGRIKFSASKDRIKKFLFDDYYIVNSILISRDACGNYFASLSMACSEPFLEELEKTGSVAGYTANSEKLFICSDGRSEENPVPDELLLSKFKMHRERMKKKRELARERGVALWKAKNYQREKRQAEKLNQKLKRRRKEYILVRAKREVERNDVIIVDAIRNKDILRGIPDGEPKPDVAWNNFCRKLEAKADNYGRKFFRIRLEEGAPHGNVEAAVRVREKGIKRLT